MTAKEALNELQRRILEAVKANTVVRRVGPTLETVANATGIALSTVQWNAKLLAKHGWLIPPEKGQHRQLLLVPGKRLPKKQ